MDLDLESLMDDDDNKEYQTPPKPPVIEPLKKQNQKPLIEMTLNEISDEIKISIIGFISDLFDTKDLKKAILSDRRPLFLSIFIIIIIQIYLIIKLLK